MLLTQTPNDTIREKGFVSDLSIVHHTIDIQENDKKFIEKAAYYIVYWFIDCIYVGQTSDFTFSNWYTTENEKYQVEALLLVSFEPVSITCDTFQLQIIVNYLWFYFSCHL